jgi:2-iminobutanoate/2-iminopropanoate deaminase
MAEKHAIATDKAELPQGPYSQALIVGRNVYISGQTGTNPTSGKLVHGGCLAEAEQVMQNLQEVLTACHCSFEDVVKVTIFLRDFDLFPQVNRIYQKYVAPPYPARSTVGVTHLANEARIEIEMWALQPESSER